MADQPKPPARPVRRYTVDGDEIKTGAAIIGARARNAQLPEGDDRIDALKSHIAERKALDNSEKDLTAAFKDAEARFTGGVAAQPLAAAENGLDQLFAQLNEAAGERVAYSKLSVTEKKAQATATALADVLTERGIVPEPPTPTVAGDEYDEYDEPLPDEPEAQDGEQLFGWYDEVEQRWYATDKDGHYLTNPDGSYKTYNDVVGEDELAEGDNVEGYLTETDEWEES